MCMFLLCKISSIDLQYYIYYMKSVRIQSFSGLYFLAFQLNSKRYDVFRGYQKGSVARNGLSNFCPP